MARALCPRPLWLTSSRRARELSSMSEMADTGCSVRKTTDKGCDSQTRTGQLLTLVVVASLFAVTAKADNDNFAVNDPGFPINEYAYSGMSNFVVYS